MSASFLPTQSHRHPHKLVASILTALVITLAAATAYSLAQPDIDRDGCQRPGEAPSMLCDNSDPACPSDIKTGGCFAAPLTASPKSQNIVTSEAASITGGK